ncbi:hypothetical protein ACLI4R_17535 [Natrialbaceae archaeon A-chndr2]
MEVPALDDEVAAVLAAEERCRRRAGVDEDNGVENESSGRGGVWNRVRAARRAVVAFFR